MSGEVAGENARHTRRDARWRRYRYHDIGAFAADIANLSRIVTLHDLSLGTPSKDGGGLLSMEATARTYRYLDPAEVAAQAAQKKPAAGAKKP